MASRRFALLAALLLSACSGSLIDHLGLTAESCPQTATAGCGLVCQPCALIANQTAQCVENSCLYTAPDGGSTTCQPPSLAYPGGCATPNFVAAGGNSSCAIVGGAVECWGVLPGQGGASSDLPVVVAGITGASQVAVGPGHACAIQNSQVLCWGNNESGQLGQPASAAIGTPAAVAGLSSPRAVAVGGQHTCALTSSGVFCWGNDDAGQLGDAGGSRSTPQLVTGSANATAVSTGTAHTCMGTATGASCWGAGAQGQIGNGAQSSVSQPTAVTFKSGGGSQPALPIASGEQHNCGVANGALQCWGAGTAGQLGDGSVGNQSLPQKVGLLNPTVIAGGGLHSCAASAGGAAATGDDDGATSAGLYCWGDNSKGQLGTGSTGGGSLAPSSTPLSLSATVSTVAAGTQHACALLLGGALLCWGANDSGQVGNGTNQPVVASPSQIVSAAK